MTEWKPIETAPIAEWVLVWGPTAVVHVAGLCRVGDITWWSEGISGPLRFSPTHWMPLPAPPAPDQEQKR